MKILITGFQPFGKETSNPSFEAVKLLPEHICGAEIIRAEIPVVFRKGAAVAAEMIRREQPDVVLHVGQAGGRTAMTVERVAINVEDCPTGFPDNEGNTPADEMIAKDGPAAYFSTLPIKAMVKAMMDGGVPAQVSNTAGTYVCNDLMYHTLHLLSTEFPHIRGGFIHVPYATSQLHPNMASMPLELIAKGLELSIEACIRNREDIALSSGTTH